MEPQYFILYVAQLLGSLKMPREALDCSHMERRVLETALHCKSPSLLQSVYLVNAIKQQTAGACGDLNLV